MFKRFFKDRSGQQTFENSSDLRSSALSTGRLHLGCGGNVMQGWTNIDLDPQPGAHGWNLTDPLPLPDSTIQYIFSEHFIEHISWAEGQRFLLECRRVLKPRGALRLSTPDLAFILDQYRIGRINEWSDMRWLPETPCAMINEGLRLWGHQYVYDRPELHRALKMAGFSKIEDAGWKQGTVSELTDLEIRPWHHELIVEAWS
jgi:predicted SAM-dependent methyltransferase